MFHLVISTIVAPVNNGVFMEFCMPVTWKSGKVPKMGALGGIGFQFAYPLITAFTVAFVWRQPFGCPVVPEL